MNGAALKERIDFLRSISENLSEGVLALDREGRLAFMNPAMERLLGWSQAELAGRIVHPIIHARRPDGDAVPEERCPMLAVLRTGSPHRDDEDYLTRSDGSLLPVSLTASPILNGGHVEGLVVACQDSTEHRLLAEASHLLGGSSDATAMLRDVARLAASTLGSWCTIALLDAEGRARLAAVETADPARAGAARDILEAAGSPADLSSRHGLGEVLRTGEAEWLRDIPDSPGGAETAERGELLRGVEVQSFMAVPMRARDRLLGAIGFAIADSARRFDERDLALAGQLAQTCALALDNLELHRSGGRRSMEEMLAIVSHDLKSFLSTILMSSRNLQNLAPKGPEGEAVRRSSGVLARSVTHMGRLVDDLVDFASIEAGRLSVSRTQHDAASLVRDAIEALRPMAEDAGVLLAADLAPGTPSIACDRDRVIQVLSNLLSNAIHVSPRGGVVTVAVAGDGDHALFSVTDVGPGIPPEELASIFERYRRGRSAQYRGAGLGLSIARTLVELHGGRIWAESTLGSGSAFRFQLPAVKLEPPPSILVVDDDADIRWSLRTVLALEGFPVAEAADGREAWEWLKSAPPPALIFLDLMMPVMSGIDLLALIRADSRLRSVPVIFVTAFGSLAEPVAAESQGVLPKPYEPDRVMELVSRYCPAASPPHCQSRV